MDKPKPGKDDLFQQNLCRALLVPLFFLPWNSRNQWHSFNKRGSPLSKVIQHQSGEAASKDQNDEDNVVPGILGIVIVEACFLCLNAEIFDLTGEVLVHLHPEMIRVVWVKGWTKYEIIDALQTGLNFPDVGCWHFDCTRQWYPLPTEILRYWPDALKVYLLSFPGYLLRIKDSYDSELSNVRIYSDIILLCFIIVT